MGRSISILILGLCAACDAVAPEPPNVPPVPMRDGIPITIVNEDDAAAEIEITLYNAVTGEPEASLTSFVLSPGESNTVRLEPTRGRDDAFHLKVNGFVAVSSDFAGCDLTEVDPRLPRSLTISVMPNGEPGACPWVEG